MNGPFTAIANSRYSLTSGTSGTVTVPAGASVIGFSCVSTSGGTVTITPGGANQRPSALNAIAIPAGTAYEHPWLACLGQLGAGTSIVFASTDSYVVHYAYQGGTP